MLDRLDSKRWLKYIRLYEDFNREIPTELKEVMAKLRKNLGNIQHSYTIVINLSDYSFADIKVNLCIDVEIINSFRVVDYTDRELVYSGDINIYQLITNDTAGIDLNIIIKDYYVDNERLYSLISHEFRHIYDVFTIESEEDMASFTKSLYLARLNNNYTITNDIFKNFLFLVYLSLEHEMVARNTMIYENYINCKCSKVELYKLFETSYIYKSFKQLQSFDSSKMLKIDSLYDDTQAFASFFNIDIAVDVEVFYKNWERYFKKVSSEYLVDAYKILDNIYDKVNESAVLNPKTPSTIFRFIIDTYINKPL